jgi:polyphosphate kinase
MTVPQAPSQVSPQTPGSSLSSPDAGGLDDPSLFLNRELSWLEFNQRVLDEASDPTVPLLERVKFLSIMCSNLDEFFMVRVAGTKQQIASGLIETGPDGMLPQDVLGRVGQRAQKMVSDLYRLWQKDLQPCLHQVGIDILSVGELDLDQRRFAYNYFNAQVYPALTPLAVDPGHPFPNVRNKTLNLAILLQRGTPGLRGQEASFAVMQVPSVFSRLIEIPASSPRRAFVCLEDVISLHVADLFPGAKVLGCWPFRVLRNFDMTIDEDESMDLLQTIQKEVRRRDRQPAVRMDCHAGMDLSVRRFLEGELELSGQDVFPVAGPLNLADLMEVYAKSPAREVRDLYDEPFVPKVPSRLQDASTMFEAIVQGDILLHQPYESFESVVDFIEEAAEDPNVLAMKATLYRTSGNSPIVAALVRAAELGKQVTALVELKARFDEENNIVWARKLEEAGVHVVYGLMGLKTHCKVALVVRREGGSIRRYVHLSTGNYNSQTAKVYTDLSFFTCREEFGIDASALFNMLTGYSQPPKWHRFVIAPLGLRERILEHIDAEAQNARAGRSARRTHPCRGRRGRQPDDPRDLHRDRGTPADGVRHRPHGPLHAPDPDQCLDGHADFARGRLRVHAMDVPATVPARRSRTHREAGGRRPAAVLHARHDAVPSPGRGTQEPLEAARCAARVDRSLVRAGRPARRDHEDAAVRQQERVPGAR